MLDRKLRGRVLKRRLTVKRLIELAGGLLGDDEDNREYRRALGELVCDAAGLPMFECLDDVIQEIQAAAMRDLAR